VENAPVLLVPGFFLFVLMRQKNKKLTNSDGIRFIVSVFLVSFILLALSHLLTTLLKTYLSEYLISIPLHVLDDLNKIIKDVEVDVYLNSFAVAVLWFLVSKIDLKIFLNLILKKSFFEELLTKAESIKNQKGKGVVKLPWPLDPGYVLIRSKL